MTMTFIQRLLFILDLSGNVFFGGNPFETMSAHLWRLHQSDKPAGQLMHFVDVLFRWQRYKNHCQRAFYKLAAGVYLPEDYGRVSREEALEFLQK